MDLETFAMGKPRHNVRVPFSGGIFKKSMQLEWEFKLMNKEEKLV